MKRILATILSVMLVATLAISGTVAYLTDDESEVNVMTVGKVDIELIEHERVPDDEDPRKPEIDGALQPFTDDKNMMPVTGDVSGDDTWGLSKETNYEDKIVRVTNKGKSDAWVRIFVAVPSELEAVNNDPSRKALHWDSGAGFNDTKDTEYTNTPYEFDTFFVEGWDQAIYENQAIKVIDGDEEKVINFNIYCFTSATPLKPGETTPAAIKGIYLDADVDYNDEDTSEYPYYLGDKTNSNNKIEYDLNGKVYIPVFAQAVQAEGFASAKLAFSGANGEYGDTDDTMPYNPWAVSVNVGDSSTSAVGGTKVSTDDELAAALKTNAKNIVVDLEDDVTLPISAWVESYYIGGKDTQTITINGNGNTLTFDHKNTDWNYLRANSDTTKLVFNNVNLTNIGANNGPWNRHDIRFYNEVSLNNVTSDKAIALLNDANLKTVTICDTHPDNSDAYGLWISADGQTVNIDGLLITAYSSKTGDRGIKIDEQYVGTPEKVTLKINNAKFVTQKKAAITVKSKAGADITLSTINIAGVAQDATNAVWVDGDSAAYADKVVVNGGTVIVEP